MGCRAALYDDYRAKCNGVKTCPLYTDCQEYGVGSEQWPVTSYMPLGIKNRRDADANVIAGMHCSTGVIWKDSVYRSKLLECGGKLPNGVQVKNV